MKRIILCADDYGQNTAISQAIIELIKKNHLSATSCMTNSYYWLNHAKWLLEVKDQVDIGLHFNLTQGNPITKSSLGTDFKPLSDLMLHAYMGKLDKEAIEIELYAQIDQFESGIGRLPDYIDGHQHIQQLPVIRDIFLKVYEKRLRQSGAYVRSVYQPQAFSNVKASGYFKTLIVQLCGSYSFNKALIKQNVPHNTSFAGFYNFARAKDYAVIFPEFLRQISDRGIIMSHPGLSAPAEYDSIAEARYLEYQYLKSDQFADLCAREQITLGRFK